MEYWQNLNRLSQAQQQATAQPEAQAFQPAAGFQTGAQNLQTFLQVGAAFFQKGRFEACAHVGTKTHWHIFCFCHASSCAVISFSSNSNNSSSKPMDFRLHWSRLPQLGNRPNSCISTSRSPTGMLMPQSLHLHRFVTFLQARS